MTLARTHGVHATKELVFANFKGLPPKPQLKSYPVTQVTIGKAIIHDTLDTASLPITHPFPQRRRPSPNHDTSLRKQLQRSLIWFSRQRRIA
jgi:hypothetical protein